MPASPQETPWHQTTKFLLTLGVLIVCALILFPFFSALVGAIVLAVVTQRPYDWLATKIKHPSTCAALALVLVILSVIIPSLFPAEHLGRQPLRALHPLREDSRQPAL